MNKRYFLALNTTHVTHIVALDLTHAREIFAEEAEHPWSDDEHSDDYVVWKEIAPHIAAGVKVPDGTLDTAEVGAFFTAEFP